MLRDYNLYCNTRHYLNKKKIFSENRTDRTKQKYYRQNIDEISKIDRNKIYRQFCTERNKIDNPKSLFFLLFKIKTAMFPCG